VAARAGHLHAEAGALRRELDDALRRGEARTGAPCLLQPGAVVVDEHSRREVERRDADVSVVALRDRLAQ